MPPKTLLTDLSSLAAFCEVDMRKPGTKITINCFSVLPLAMGNV